MDSGVNLSHSYNHKSPCVSSSPSSRFISSNFLKVSSSFSSSDALPLPLYLTNVSFFTVFFSVVYYLLLRWCEKIRNFIPLHIVTLPEMFAIATFFAFFIYLLGFFGIGFVQSLIIPCSLHDKILDEDDDLIQ